MYSVVFDEKAKVFLERMDRTSAIRIFRKIQKARSEPFLHFARLSGRPDFKLRVGDWRVIADIDVAASRIEITKIGHRKNVYD